MAPITIPEWTCAHCGNKETLMLVNAPAGLVSAAAEEHRPARAVPALDWTCSHCGTMETYELVPAQVREHGR